MNPPILASIKNFLNNDSLETLELDFSIFSTTLFDSSFRMKNLPSKRSFWKIFIQKSILGNVTFYFRDGPKYVFALVVEDEYLPYENEDNEFVIDKFIVLGADPIAGTKIKMTDDLLTVNANISRTGGSLAQEYKNCISISSHREKLSFETLTKNPQGSDNCYIATLVYKDANHPRVGLLRIYRDEVLSKTVIGRTFIYFYYSLAPKFIVVLKPFPFIQRNIKKSLDSFTDKLM